MFYSDFSHGKYYNKTNLTINMLFSNVSVAAVRFSGQG